MLSARGRDLRAPMSQIGDSRSGASWNLLACRGPLRRPVTWHAYVPKLVTVLRLGYTTGNLRADLFVSRCSARHALSI
jgi:hypothetical protein